MVIGDMMPLGGASNKEFYLSATDSRCHLAGPVSSE